MARATNSLPVPDSPVTRIVEFESLMRSMFRATSHIARLLKTIPGNELAGDIVVIGRLTFSTGAPDDRCEWARWATSLNAFNSFACCAVSGRTQRPYNAAPSRVLDGNASSRQIA